MLLYADVTNPLQAKSIISLTALDALMIRTSNNANYYNYDKVNIHR